ncbi:Sec63-domain-containing protein [Fistulina hepatica ATCC 64428]|uniref:Sec63-domain-containing protein n=1 Tax=Fistulina hepatica ATCC 64428 TaxID=1128425 RepID=A0A0D7A725_9AGAR|nr:Sec63-domain-containing protein [Fistulina hepatica ATCC 64428]
MTSATERDEPMDDYPADDDLSPEAARRRLIKAFEENAARPLFSGTAEKEPERLPNVYTSASIVQGNVLSQFGSKYLLPIGTERNQHEEYEEVIVPPVAPVPPRSHERLIPVSELDDLASNSFPGYKMLNRIQSIVYPTAYGSNENMLGKTDVAMLTILRVLDQHRTPLSNQPIKATIRRDAFKIIYVQVAIAPMKALAAEIVRKLGKRLQWLSIQVRELTGDMQMTKSEIAATQIIVTTPEKWDVVTRKPTGEGELASLLKLLIIDEVHLLNDERGAVIETIVARTLRQVESSQSVIRILGLSATLPNYVDVADFLCVSRYKGLFYFDSSFRPVPLEQHFLGIRGKPGSAQARKNIDQVAFWKVAALVEQGHQVMVFVHSRKETVKSALALRDAAQQEGNLDDFSCEDHPRWSFFRREVGESRNKEMRQLFDSGFGIHHAGMLRSDRNLMERMFSEKAIKVLCCTATLAWGVNLPAHAVLIKGTQVYDSSKGSFVDLSVLDVLQILGRAGRPGLESSGEGYIATTEDKLTHYLDAVASQFVMTARFHALNSHMVFRFQGGLVDALNAEISLGTVSNTGDAVKWLGYTYLFVRMRRNPFVYGIPYEELADDPQLGSKRHQLITASAEKLADACMIIFDRRSGKLAVTDLGRIAARYYIRHASIEIFNQTMRPKMSEADVLAMLSMSTEFAQIQVRESEQQELEGLMEAIPCQVKGGLDSTQGKVNVLLQAYISRLLVDDFALVSDSAYVAQNGGRIVRALLEIAISRKWANVTAVLMGLSKAVEKRLWPFDQPLKQFELKADVLYGLERCADELAPTELASMSAQELGELVHLNERHGAALLAAAKQFPTAAIQHSLRPLASHVLKIVVKVTKAFEWNNRLHGSLEPFWVWVEDDDALTIYQIVHLAFRPDTDTLDVDFVISIPEGQTLSTVTIRFVSDRWMGAEEEVRVPLEGLVMPSPPRAHTQLLDLPYLSLSALRNSRLEKFIERRVKIFNTMQTHIFWSLMHTKWHSLVCAPAGAGKSVMGHILALLTAISTGDSAWILIVTPQSSVAADALSELRYANKELGVSVEPCTTQNALKQPAGRCIRIVTAPTLLQAISDRCPKNSLVGIDLVICENLEQLDAPYELAVSILRHATQTTPTRYVGLSSSLGDAADLAHWLDVDTPALYTFRPVDRDQALTTSAQTFTIPQSASLFKAMAKPVNAAILAAPIGESAIVFVPSRQQCRAIALDLLTQCTLETESARGYLRDGDVPDALLEAHIARLRDPTLADFIARGVGFFGDDAHPADRACMLELYAEGVLRVLLVPRQACWALPVRAAVVVVMGTQYLAPLIHGQHADRQLRDYSLVELVHMQGRAIRPHGAAGHFYLFCQAEAKDTFMHFLNEGLPLESQLLETDDLQGWYNARRRAGDFEDPRQAVDALSFTFLARRLRSNPAFYDCASASRDENLSLIPEVTSATEDARWEGVVFRKIYVRDVLGPALAPFKKKTPVESATPPHRLKMAHHTKDGTHQQHEVTSSRERILEPEAIKRISENLTAGSVLLELGREEVASLGLFEPNGDGLLHRRVGTEDDARRSRERRSDDRRRADQPADAPPRRGERLSSGAHSHCAVPHPRQRRDAHMFPVVEYEDVILLRNERKWKTREEGEMRRKRKEKKRSGKLSKRWHGRNAPLHQT